MKKLLSILGVFLVSSSFSQVGINATGDQPNQRAMLDVSSNSKGFLPPRLTQEERDLIEEPVPAGLMIFNTTTGCTNVYSGISWFELCGTCTPQPSVANAGSDQLNLTGNSTSLAANTPTSGTGIWSVISGEGGNFNDPSNPLSDFNGVSGNTYVLRWTIGTNCGTSYDDVTISFVPSFTCGNPISFSGDSYSTALFGNACWFTKNLNVGSQIDITTNMSNNGVIEKYCYGGLASNCELWGGLYQWNELLDYGNQSAAQGLCPTGWHIATNAEWAAAISINQSGLLSQNSGVVCNGGNCGGNIYYANSGNYGYYWTSSEQDATTAFRRIFAGSSLYQSDSINKLMGLSARCVKN